MPVAAPSFDSHLLTVPAAQHSSLQNEVLSLIFGAKGSHAAHLYRNLPGPQPISITRSYLPAIQTNDYWVSAMQVSPQREISCMAFC